MNPISELISKYNVAVPRYTSYPTVPYWEDNLNQNTWINSIQNNFKKDEGISLYVHLPFCESLCTYCGCNKRITKNHAVELPYIETLLQEWQMYLALFPEKPIIKEIHLGGGTPTFFSAENLSYLILTILESVYLAPEAELSVEVHPNYTNSKQLQALYDVGFRRLSVGIQDFDEKVQFLINRPQSFKQTQTIFEEARKIGYTSINADIIYGLPAQSLQTIEKTIEYIKILKPERIAFYSYAHVPWKIPAQRRYTEDDLPQAQEKQALYELGRDLLKESGYVDIGLDHFSLPQDTLYQASLNGTLHRNFMGYTTQTGNLLIGLGASSISDTGDAFMQNIKEIEAYQKAIEQKQFAIFKGHLLTQEDKLIRQYILDIMCSYQTTFGKEMDEKELEEYLDDLIKNHLIVYKHPHLQVTDLGKMFLRNIALQIDKRYWAKQENAKVFSNAI
ncbi:coproporphyrinogen III oxidase [bacterium 336/3]|nr:coproporphyrinogen III oxidase [bacterium 336/3]